MPNKKNPAAVSIGKLGEGKTSPAKKVSSAANGKKGGRPSQKQQLERARTLIMHAVSAMFDGCGNSYSNSYTEKWLRGARALGAYHGEVIGTIRDLEAAWEEWQEKNEVPNINTAAPEGQL